MQRVIAVVLAIGLAPAVSGADCALMGLEAKVVTPSGVAVPHDGGVVVAAMSVERGALDPGDVAVRTDWRMSDTIGTEVPRIVTIAPGLAVYRRPLGSPVSAAPSSGLPVRRLPDEDASFALQDAARATLGTFARAEGKARKLPAPKVKRVHIAERVSRRSRTDVIAVLRASPPPGAYALVLADRKGAPRSWWTLEPDSLTQRAFSTRDCHALPNGTVPSRAGEKVKLFWLMIDGRTSPMAGPFTIARR